MARSKTGPNSTTRKATAAAPKKGAKAKPTTTTSKATGGASKFEDRLGQMSTENRADAIYQEAKRGAFTSKIMELTIVRIVDEPNLPKDKDGNPRRGVHVYLSDGDLSADDFQRALKVFEDPKCKRGFNLQGTMVRATFWGEELHRMEESFTPGDKVHIAGYTRMKLFRFTTCFNVQFDDMFRV